MADVIDLIEALNRKDEVNGEPVYWDQDALDAATIANTDPGEELVLHDLACTRFFNGECSHACYSLGILQTDAWDEETTPE